MTSNTAPPKFRACQKQGQLTEGLITSQWEGSAFDPSLKRRLSTCGALGLTVTLSTSTTMAPSSSSNTDSSSSNSDMEVKVKDLSLQVGASLLSYSHSPTLHRFTEAPQSRSPS